MTNIFDLTGKVALVTGGARSIGLALGIGLGQAGARVCFNCTSEKSLLEGLKAYEEAGIQAKGFIADVSDEGAVRKLVADIENQEGGIDILVNNAGVSASEKIGDYTAEMFQKTMDLNVTAVFNCTRAVVDGMKERHSGVILNTSSMVSRYAQPGGVAYPTSKFAVNGMTLALARELGPDGIRVNAVAPGITKTDMVAALPEQMIAPLIAQIPLRRIGEPEDIANAFVFLASDKASYISGQVLGVDGLARS